MVGALHILDHTTAVFHGAPTPHRKMCQDGVMAEIVLDVRTPSEFAAGHLRGAVNIDYRAADFHEKAKLLNPDDSYVIYCGGGGRASRAKNVLESLGCSKAASYGLRGAALATGLPVITDEPAGGEPPEPQQCSIRPPVNPNDNPPNQCSIRPLSVED